MNMEVIRPQMLQQLILHLAGALERIKRMKREPIERFHQSVDQSIGQQGVCEPQESLWRL
jgi:hypothetical protein